jgi:hypothetical protein
VVWTLTCACGERVTAPSENEVVRLAELHVAEQHPLLAGATEPGDLLAMAQQEDGGDVDVP